MKKKVLIVEDDKRILDLLHDYFAYEYDVVEARNGAQALIEYERREIDLIILDIMLPVLDGWAVCRAIRNHSYVPIIMLTAKTDEESNLRGFSLGVDDYVTKPFSPKVLLAKVQAIFKRIENRLQDVDGIYQAGGDFILNEPAHKVTVCGKTINLTATEFSLLAFLVKNSGIMVSRDAILDAVWGVNYFGDYRIVDTNIKRLREKLSLKADFIKTIRGSGYIFEVE